MDKKAHRFVHWLQFRHLKTEIFSVKNVLGIKLNLISEKALKINSVNGFC